MLITDVFQSAVIVVASARAADRGADQRRRAASNCAEAISNGPPRRTWRDSLVAACTPGHEILGPLLVVAWLIIPTIGRGGSVDLDGQRIFSCPTRAKRRR